MGLSRPRKLKLIESPAEDSIDAAERELTVLNLLKPHFNVLQALGAIVINKKKLKLTPQGEQLCRFPLNPDQAKYC